MFSFGKSVSDADEFLPGEADQNNVQHQPPGEPEAVHQQPAPPGGVHDQCQRHGDSFPDLGLFLQNQGDQVTGNGRGTVNRQSSWVGWAFAGWGNTFWLSTCLSLVCDLFIPVRRSHIY